MTREEGGRGRYFPEWVGEGALGPGLDFDPAIPGAPKCGGEDHWHEVDKDGKRVKEGGRDRGHHRPGDPNPIPSKAPNVEREIGDIDGIVPPPPIVDWDTLETIGISVGVATVIVAGAIIVVVAGEAMLVGGAVTAPIWAPRLSPVFARGG